VVLKSALDRLTDPQCPVGRELESATPVELLDRPDQPEHSLLNEVLHRQAVALVAPGLGDDQPQVRIDHSLLGGQVAALDPLGQLDLLGGGEQRVRAGIAQEQFERIRDRATLDLDATALLEPVPVLGAPAGAAVGSGGSSGLGSLIYLSVFAPPVGSGATSFSAVQLGPRSQHVRCASNYS
jgi:hypothetical protein